MGLEMTTLLSVVDSLDALKGLVNLVHRVINQWHCDSFPCFTEIYVPIAVPSIVKVHRYDIIGSVVSNFDDCEDSLPI